MLRNIKDFRLKNFSMDLLRIFIKIYGLNRRLSSIFLSRFGINTSIGVICYLIDRNRTIADRLLKLIGKSFLIDTDLKKLEITYFFSKKNTKWFKYFSMGKPVRGQRTKTNARTAKKKLYFNYFTNVNYSQLLSEMHIKNASNSLDKLFKF